jgi:diguanylate cyclase (GGDEF)-like protein
MFEKNCILGSSISFCVLNKNNEITTYSKKFIELMKKKFKTKSHQLLAREIHDFFKLNKDKENLMENIEDRIYEFSINFDYITNEKLVIVNDVTYQKNLEEISYKDNLTLLYNRRFLDIIYKEILSSLRNKNYFINMLLIDVDNFKLYNDTYGHVSGDNVLQKIAKEILGVFKRENDYSFRLGGEEFCSIFKTNKIEDAINLSKKLQDRIKSLSIEHAKNNSGIVTVSGGLIEIKEKKDFNEFFSIADSLLYIAKDNGRNKIVHNLGETVQDSENLIHVFK